ncbi:MAG: hypothetical protein ACTSRS_17895 [Candidatus Helarchaeota archaeon]
MDSKNAKEFLFKILILGTSDNLKAEFLELISQKSWRIDGVSGHIHSTDGVTLDIWFPRENASSKILASFSYSDANGVIIVMGRRDRRILRKMKKNIQQRVGNVPWVAIVLRRNMSIGAKAVKTLHAIKMLSEKMKDISQQTQIPPSSSNKRSSPSAIAGKPTYYIDNYGFVVPDSSTGIPLFVQKASKKKDSETE